VQRCRGACSRGAEVQKCRGAEVVQVQMEAQVDNKCIGHWFICAEVQRSRVREVQRCRVAEVQIWSCDADVVQRWCRCIES